MDENKKDDLINAGKLLTPAEVLKMWPIRRETLSRLTNHANEAERIPAYGFGRKRLYAYDELMWWRDKHRFVPIKKKRKTQ